MYIKGQPKVVEVKRRRAGRNEVEIDETKGRIKYNIIWHYVNVNVNVFNLYSALFQLHTGQIKGAYWFRNRLVRIH